MSAGGAVMFSSLTVAERMFAGRPASVWRSRSLPILIFLQLFHSSIQLGSCRPLSLRSPNLQLPSSLVPPASCASCDNKGKFIWARGAAVLGSPIEISIVLHLFLVRRWVFRLNAFSWSEIADGFLTNPMWADFADFFLFFFAILKIAVSSFCHLSINYRT